MIELRHIQYFVSASEHGSFRKAATFLNIQESAVSRRIRDLEDRLGASLFHRHPGGVALTMAGQRFLRRVRIALQQIEVGINDVAAIGRSEDGIIKVGIFSSLASGFLFELVKGFDAKHPRVAVELIEGIRRFMSPRSASFNSMSRSSPARPNGPLAKPNSFGRRGCSPSCRRNTAWRRSRP
ncbi:LysR family transcriptional regulator [Rhizorhabdus histidinilytica]